MNTYRFPADGEQQVRRSPSAADVERALAVRDGARLVIPAPSIQRLHADADLVREQQEQLVEVTDDALPFPVDALPPLCRSLAIEGAAALGIDAGFIGAPIIGALAGAIGSSRVVEVRTGWREPALTWILTDAPSGAGKSPAIDLATDPLRRRDAELAEKTRRASDDYKARLAQWQQRQRRKEGDAGPPPEPPPRLAAVCDSFTMEALGTLLAANPKGLTLVADEAASWLNSFDAYRAGRGGDEQKWLALYGARPLKIDRQTGQLYVRRPCVSIVAGVQPRVLARALGRERRESGLAARILVASPPVTAAVWTDAYIPTETTDAYRMVVSSLLDLSLSDEPVALRLSADARDQFRLFHDELAVIGAAAGRDGDEDAAAAAAKLRSAVPRIALCLALAKAAEAGVAELLREVDATAMAGAIRLGRHFEGQARQAYARWRAQDGAPVVAKILRAIREAGPDGATRTEIRDALSRNYSREEVDAALDELRRGGLIALIPSAGATIGRPTERWRAC